MAVCFQHAWSFPRISAAIAIPEGGLVTYGEVFDEQLGLCVQIEILADSASRKRR